MLLNNNIIVLNHVMMPRKNQNGDIASYECHLVQNVIKCEFPMLVALLIYNLTICYCKVVATIASTL